MDNIILLASYPVDLKMGKASKDGRTRVDKEANK